MPDERDWVSPARSSRGTGMSLRVLATEREAETGAWANVCEPQRTRAKSDGMYRRNSVGMLLKVNQPRGGVGCTTGIGKYFVK